MQTGISNSTKPDSSDGGGCGDSSGIEQAARELYQTAALLVGREDAALRLVEETVASIEVDPCADGGAARELANTDLIRRTLAQLASQQPAAMQPAGTTDLGGCVDTDDLSAAGLSREQFDRLFAGSGRARMRQWLDGLGPAERSVFVLRAMLGRTGAETAELLREATGRDWTPADVGGAYRAALCSLASSLAHSAA